MPDAGRAMVPDMTQPCGKFARADTLDQLVERDKDHDCQGLGPHHICVRVEAVAQLPSRFGGFHIVAFWNNRDGKEHIAMVHGDALAGGCEMALHCDFRVAAEVARFGMPLARLGLVAPFELTCKLIEVIGTAFTKQFLLTAQPIDAIRAYEIGLVHQVVPAADLEQSTYTMARAIAGNAPLALQGIKTTIQRVLSLREQIAHADLDALIERTRHSADAREGVRAWLEKRPAIFRGE